MDVEPETSEDRLLWRVCVRRKDIPKIIVNIDRIQTLFRVRLFNEEVSSLRSVQDDISDLVWFSVSPDKSAEHTPELIPRLQRYVDSCAETHEEDSSYDSDCESTPHGHDDVSRTVSDTLGAEFAEYVSAPPPGYTQRVEFGLKLGYTERQVQAALAKLGPNPGQNELLAELIKLGASRSLSADFSPGSEAGLGVEDGDDAEEGETEEAVGSNGHLRHIVIDGSNVAMSHGNKESFSCRGIKICVDWFRSRGHKDVTVFVPRWRKEASRPERPITDQEILMELERERLLVFTPSRLVGGKRVACYDDRYVLKLAAETDGVVVSNDNYRDLISQCPEFRRVVEERILMYSFVNDKFMPPDDPLGRTGPTLENFLRVSPVRAEPPRPCPYGKKCTYGNKCKYAHPERGPLPHKSVSERLAEHAQRQLQARASRDASPGDQLKTKSLSLPLRDESQQPRKTPLSRTKSSVPAPVNLTERRGVAKSRSVENVAAPPPGFGFRVPPPQQSYQQQQQQQLWSMQPPPEWHGLLQGGHVTVAKQLSDPLAQEQAQSQPEPTANLHRKLQRQLTLNPAYDPRLFHLQQGYHNSTYQEHRPVARHSSATTDYRHSPQAHQQPPPGPQGWDRLSSDPLHQSVTRIASAPEPLPPRWPPTPNHPPPSAHMQHPRLSASSEPNLMMPPPSWPPLEVEAARSRINYHLSSIFPAEQVQAAMRLLPDETDPQKICAAILDMFPKN